MLKPIEFIQNPEYALVLLAPGEFRLYCGDNQQLELLELQEVALNSDSLLLTRQPQVLKNFAWHLLQMPRLSRLPVVVAGVESLRLGFLKVFPHSYGVIHYQAKDLCQATCPEILREADHFRDSLREIYLAHFQQRLKSLLRTGRAITCPALIDHAIEHGLVHRLLLTKAPEAQTPEAVRVGRVSADGAQVQLVPRSLLMPGQSMLAILRGKAHVHTPLFAMEA